MCAEPVPPSPAAPRATRPSPDSRAPCCSVADRYRRLHPLLAAVAEGDQGALADFYDATQRNVYSLAVRILGDHQRAEEVTLDVYLQVWRQASSFEPERGHAGTWLMTIARSRALDRRRSADSLRRREDLVQDTAEPLAQNNGRPRPSEEPGDPQRMHADLERRSLVREAIRSLPAEQRTVIELAFFPGRTHREIADRLGEPLGTVKTRIRLGMRKLKEKLQGLEEAR